LRLAETVSDVLSRLRFSGQTPDTARQQRVSYLLVKAILDNAGAICPVSTPPGSSSSLHLLPVVRSIAELRCMLDLSDIRVCEMLGRDFSSCTRPAGRAAAGAARSFAEITTKYRYDETRDGFRPTSSSRV
jgi:hypothetical protein